MKTYITIILFLVGISQSSIAQQLNWSTLETETKNIVHFNFGYDYSATAELGYSRLLNTSIPILLSTDISIPMGNILVDDLKYRVGGQIRFLNYGNFSASAKIMGSFRTFNNELVQIASFGAELSTTLGYYKPGWYLAGEVGFDKSIISNLKHKEVMKDNYPAINDGWYIPSGGNYFLGIQAGLSLKRQMNLGIRMGLTNAEKDHENAQLPGYAQIGISKRF